MPRPPLFGLVFVLHAAMASSEEVRPGSHEKVSINESEFGFRYCPPGQFLMGSSEEAKPRYEDEFVRPHRVKLTQGFWLQETEVTQTQYFAVMRDNPSFWRGKSDSDHPVERISWTDANEFCAKLSTLDSEAKYRLPTEAEWEYACRAGSTGPNYGKIEEIAWFFDNTGVGDGTGSYGHRPVRRKRPNKWGLFDMLGNVEEWCEDWYGPAASQMTTDPPGPKTGTLRIIRGGSCFSEIYWPTAGGLMAGYRSRRPPDFVSRTVGFRVVRVHLHTPGITTR